MRQWTLAAVLLSSLAPLAAQSSRPASATTRPLAVVKGLCVADEDGAPLPGCVVRLRGSGRDPGEVALDGEISWQDPAPVTTDAAGRFTVSFVPPPAYQFELDLQAPDRAPRTGRWSRFGPGQVEDLGEIRVASGHRVHGKVLDAEGQPVAGIAVALVGLPLPLPGTRDANHRRSGVSDADGEFAIAARIPAGRWALEVDSPAVTLVSPRGCTVGADGAPVVVTVRRMPSVSGVVVDEDGRPAAGIGLWVQPGRRNTIESACTDAAGRFQLFARVDPEEPVRLATRDAGAFEPFEPTGPVAWGTSGLRITVRKALSFALQVVDHATGQPVEEFAVVCHAARAAGSIESRPRLGGRHADGKLLVDRIWRGENRLTVRPRDPRFADSEEITFEAGSLPLPAILVQLRRTFPLTVRVLERDGRPVEGSTVEIVDPIGRPFDALTMAADPRDGGTIGRVYHVALLVGTALTDRLGRATVHLPPTLENPLAVRVRGSTHPTLVVRDVRPDPGQPMLELVAPRPARVEGRLVPAGLARIPDLHVLLRSPRQQAPPERLVVAPAPDGTFVFECLPAQEVELAIELRFWVRGRTQHFCQLTSLQGVSQTLTLKEGETAHATLGAAGLEPVRIRARVVDVGGGAARGAVILSLTSEAASGSSGEFALDPEGRFELPFALPGSYRAGLRVSETKVVDLDGEFMLAPGKPGEWTFRLPAGK